MSDWDPGPLYRRCDSPDCPVAYAYINTTHYHFVGGPMADTFKVIGLTDDDLRRFALDEQRLHDPKQQADNPYERCAHCHYTRHPCSTYDLATAVLQLLDRDRPDSSWEGGEPVGEYSGLAAEQFLDRLDRDDPRRP